MAIFVFCVIEGRSMDIDIIQQLNESWFGNVASFFDSFGVWLSIIFFIALCFAVFLSLMFYTYRINEKSKQKIDNLRREKKVCQRLVC